MTSTVFSRAPALPPYSEYPADINQNDIELAKLSRTSTESTVYEANQRPKPLTLTSSFNPTTQLQIQTRGRAWLVLPFISTRPDPIVVFGLTADGRLDRPQYLSLRDKRCSGSCRLVDGEDESETPLTSTNYRWGPGRRPKVNLAQLDQQGHQEEFEIETPSVVSRTVTFRTSLGVFRWRYAGRRERAAESANNLLVLELLQQQQSGSGKQEGIKVAHLVRNEQYRTAGTRASTAGPGGRLVLDLSQIDEKHREYAQQLAVTTVIVMLKKEVDRRRFAQFMIMAGLISAI